MEAVVHDSRCDEDRSDGNSFEAIVAHNLVVKGSKFKDINVQSDENIFFFLGMSLEELLSFEVLDHQVREGSEGREAQFKV